METESKQNEDTQKKDSAEEGKQSKTGPKIAIDTQKLREMLKPDIQKIRSSLPTTSKMRSEDIEADANQSIKQKIEQIRAQIPALPQKTKEQEKKEEEQKPAKTDTDDEDLELLAIKKRSNNIFNLKLYIF